MPTTIKYRWPKLGLGTGTLASLGRAITTRELSRLLDELSASGQTLIDTADTYGSGDCERLIGRALAGRTQSFTLITKVGYRHSNLKGPLRPINQFAKKLYNRIGLKQSFAPSYVRHALSESLTRLRVTHVSAYLLHDPTLDAIQDHELLDTLQSLKTQGKAVEIGFSSSDPSVIEAGLSHSLFSVVQTPAHLRVCNQLSPLWEKCLERKVHIIGNHIFEPRTLDSLGNKHETLMRASASLLPPSATILCGTRKPSNFKDSLRWACDPMNKEAALSLINKVNL